MDSTINLWSKRRSLQKKKSKLELLSEVQEKLNKPIDLNPMTKDDITKVIKALGSVKEPMPVCNTKADYATYLNRVLSKAPSANRLSKEALKQLSEEFDDKK